MKMPVAAKVMGVVPANAQTSSDFGLVNRASVVPRTHQTQPRALGCPAMNEA